MKVAVELVVMLTINMIIYRQGGVWILSFICKCDVMRWLNTCQSGDARKPFQICLPGFQFTHELCKLPEEVWSGKEVKLSHLRKNHEATGYAICQLSIVSISFRNRS